MSESYLIVHKVRGEAAFDIAKQMACPECQGKPHCGPTDDVDTFIRSRCLECDALGYWWIIPTSGHRAYPYSYWQLNELFFSPSVDDPKIPITDASEAIMTKNWGHWPDHYRHGPAPKVDIKALFKKSEWVPNPEAFIKRRL